MSNIDDYFHTMDRVLQIRVIGATMGLPPLEDMTDDQKKVVHRFLEIRINEGMEEYYRKLRRFLSQN